MKPQTTLVSKKTADQLKEHSDRLDRVDVAVMSFERIAKQVEKQGHMLYGNGEIGIDERVRNMDKDIQQLSIRVNQFMEQQKKDKDQLKFLMYGSIFSLIGNIFMQWVSR